jgi:alpha-L-fucosidase
MITGTTLVSARCFRNDKPVSGNSTKEFRKVSPLKALPLKDAKHGIIYRYFEGNWDSLPDFKTIKHKKQGLLGMISFTPKEKEEYIAFEYSGYILIPLEDVYGFSLSSDDGSRLYIDGQLVVSNDGLHATLEKSGVIALGEGYHTFRTEYFNKTGGLSLEIFIQSSKMKKQPLPAGMLFH